MEQLELSFNDNTGLETKCVECLYDNECKDAEKEQNTAKNEKDCVKYKYNDLPF